MNTPAGRPPPNRAALVEAALDRLQAVWNQPNEDAVPVSPSQLRALNIVHAHHEINLGGLAAQMGTIPSSASRLCDRLQAAGLLERDLSPVSRREVVLREARVAAIARVLDGMPPAAQKALITGLLAFQNAALEQATDWPEDRPRTA